MMEQCYRLGFTLVELLVVIAIVAVIGAGVSVYYGRDNVDRGKREMTRHEMGQIRQAFQQCYADNSIQLMREITEHDSLKPLPTTSFINTFKAKPDQTNRLYGMVNFFERYGLWCLKQPAIRDVASGRLITFKPFDAMVGTGWQGPYISMNAGAACVVDGDNWVKPDPDKTTEIILPQIATRYEGIYRIVYFEHCEDERDTSEPIYRRLLLVCAVNDEAIDTADELRSYSGNRRKGDNAYPLNLDTGVIRTYDESKGLFFVELLNLDQWRIQQ